ncbi:MAG: helix-turn-helix domain-containing protein [Dermatophilaceae bacterium]
MSDSESVSFVDGTSRVDRLLRDPARATRVAAIREKMRDADRVHAMSLAMVRHAAGLTQSDLAGSLHVSQAAIARTEKRQDMLLSTLRSYLEAAGASALIVVELSDGTTAEITLDEAARI